MIYLLIAFSLFTSQLFCSTGSKRLENGLRIIYTDKDAKYPGSVMNVFVKGGASLSFDKKSSFAGIAMDYMDTRIKRLSRSYGFRYKTKISWDYTSYTFYLSPSTFHYTVPKILSMFFDPEPLNEQELDYLKNGASQRALWNINRRQIKYPLISFLASRQSIYSAGFDGFMEDISSINDAEFNKFAKCYFSTNNTVISFTGIKEKQIPFEDAKIYRPCFKDENFEHQALEQGSGPASDFSYYQAPGMGFIVRMGFLSSPCGDKGILYDLVSELLSRDDKLSALAGSFYPRNNCYLNTGTLDLVFSGTDQEFNPGTVLKELGSLSATVSEAELELAKKGLVSSYYRSISSKEEFSYLLAKTEVLCRGYKKLLDYPSEVKKIKLSDVKSVLNGLSSSRYSYVFMKMGK